MALNDEQWNDIRAYLNDEEGEITTQEEFVDALRKHWDDVINPTKMEKKALRRELQQLRDQKQEIRGSLDDINTRIDELVAILNP